MKYGLIAGNGRFPVLALENARRLGHEVVVLAIREEASQEVEAPTTAQSPTSTCPPSVAACANTTWLPMCTSCATCV